MITNTVRTKTEQQKLIRAIIQRVFVAGLWAWVSASGIATPVPGPWVPIFKGVDHSVGTNDPALPGSFPGKLQVVHCVRVDLRDPDVRLLATPRAPAYVAESRETLTQTVPSFLSQNKLQIAADANFYSGNPGGSDPASEGISCEVFGLQISTGAVVSAVASEADPRFATLLFSTNNEPHISFVNRPPGTNTVGMYTAVTGYYPIVSNGVNVGAASITAYPDGFIHQIQPRTAYGISADNRYLYLMSIDGRQGGYSDGALDTETADWMLQFGAWNAINMDGGGSTALYMSDSTGQPVPVNHSSYFAAYGRERYIGSHLGVYAKPLPGPINDVLAAPDDTTALITWTTLLAADSQVQYGLTTNLEASTALISESVTNHAVTLTGLSPDTGYYFKVLSGVNGNQYRSPLFYFTTTNYVITNFIFDLTNTWAFTTSNLDGISWTAPNYNDTTWVGTGPGLLWIDARGPNSGIPELNTLMPGDPNNALGPTYPFITYYFRTHFAFTNSLRGASLRFTGYIDDGAVFYLNGHEVFRLRLPSSPTVINHSTLATGYACSGDATCPDSFTVSGDLATNLFSGDNVLAAEVHNYSAGSPDITFGASLLITVPYDTSSPELTISYSSNAVLLNWNQSGFTLQQAPTPAGPWSNTPGPVVTGPYSVKASGAALYFRLIK
jgi:hypothetical protein